MPADSHDVHSLMAPMDEAAMGTAAMGRPIKKMKKRSHQDNRPDRSRSAQDRNTDPETPGAVLLIQPPQGEFVRQRIFQPGVEVPLNLLCLAGFLERAGIPCSLLDLRVEADPDQALREAASGIRPILAGISSLTSELDNAQRAATLVKEISPGTATIVGGHHFSSLPEAALADHGDFDFAVRGEGERPLAGLARALRDGRDPAGIPGLTRRRNGRVEASPPGPLIPDLDDLPFPDRRRVRLDRYVPSPATGNYLRLPTTGIIAGRGCPFNCAYCSKGVWGTSVRYRSPENVIAEIESCIGDFGVRDFRFFDDSLASARFDLERFCRLILERGLDISWNCYSRAGDVRGDLLDLMKRAGCYHIKYGIEFGTESSLRRTRKRSTLDEARTAVALTKKAGMEAKASFIFGIPGETEADCEQTLAFAIELSPDLASFYPFDLFPGSRFFEMHRDGDAPPALAREATERLTRQAYKRFYFRPAYVMQRLRRIGRAPVREARLLAQGLKFMARSLRAGKSVEDFPLRNP